MRTSTLLSKASPFGSPQTWTGIHRTTVSIPPHIAKHLDTMCPLAGLHTWLCQWAYSTIYDYLVKTYGHTPPDSLDSGIANVLSAIQRLTVGPPPNAKPRKRNAIGDGRIRRRASTLSRSNSAESGNVTHLT